MMRKVHSTGIIYVEFTQDDKENETMSGYSFTFGKMP